MPNTNQFSAVTGHNTGIDYESLIRAKAKLLPSLYAQKEIDTNRARDLAVSADRFNQNLALETANLDLIKSKNQADTQAANDALEQQQSNATIGTGLGIGGLGVSAYKAYKDMALTDKLDKILNPSAETVVPGQGGEMVNTTNMNPDAAIERVMTPSVPESEVITNFSPKTVPGTETITPEFSTLPSGDVGAGAADAGADITNQLFDTGLEDLFASQGPPATNLASSLTSTSQTPIGGFDTSMFNELPALNNAPVASWLEAAPAAAETVAAAPLVAEMASGFAPGTAAMGSGAMDAGASMPAAAAATGAGELGAMGAALEAGPFFAATYGINELMNKAILPGITRAIFGPDRFLQEIPTAEIITNYKNGDFGAGGVAPVWYELQRRGATTGLTPPTGRQLEASTAGYGNMNAEGQAALDKYWTDPNSEALYKQGKINFNPSPYLVDIGV